MGTILVRDFSNRNTTETSRRDQITMCIAIISEPCK